MSPSSRRSPGSWFLGFVNKTPTTKPRRRRRFLRSFISLVVITNLLIWYKYVGYIGDSVTFVAMGRDGSGEPAHGAKFTFESSDPNKLTIDEAGRAILLQPGTVIVTVRAGLAVNTAAVSIRSTRRRVQTDAEWRADQDSLVGDSGHPSDDSRPGVLARLMERLVPTALAQGGQGTDYGHAAPIGQVGTPPFAALEETRLGPVMPQTNFELPIPLVDLAGRGLATSLMAYYNSNTWGRVYGFTVSNALRV